MPSFKVRGIKVMSLINTARVYQSQEYSPYWEQYTNARPLIQWMFKITHPY